MTIGRIEISQMPQGTPKGTDLIPGVDVTNTTQSTTGTNNYYLRSDSLNFDLNALGLLTKTAVLCASTGAYTVTYNNGTSGIGATLTNAGAQVPFSADGITPTVGQRVLFKNQASSFQNGIYTFTSAANLGSISTSWVATRATDFDQSGDISQYVVVFVDQGATNGGLLFEQTAPGPFTIGTSPITFSQYSIPQTSITLPLSLANGGTGASLTAVSGDIVTCTASAFALSNTLPLGVQINITELGTITAGTWAATLVSPTYGGTGVNNGASTMTIGGNFAMSGAFTFTGTLTGNTAVTFPTSGTLATTSQLPTLPLSLSNGGTNANLTASNGGIFYSTGSAGAILSGTATANQILLSGSNAAPAWSTVTHPATTTANQILYSSATNVIGQITAAASSVLTTNGSSVPSLTALSSFGQLTNLFQTTKIQIFTSGTTYTPSTGMVYCWVEAVGAGAAGGGAATTTGAQSAAGSGGGGGAYCFKVYTAANIGASATLSIGSGGTAGTAGNNPGNNGGNTTFTPAGSGVALTAAGGTGGGGGAAVTVNNFYGGNGGAGGAGTNGDINLTGQTGGIGLALITTAGSGPGGHPVKYGYGGVQVSGGSSAGSAGIGHGSGGSGGANGPSASAVAGGAGTGGIIVVYEFCNQ